MTLTEILGSSDPAVRVRLSEVRGSTPREVGAEMVVNHTATWGTIGGGRLEFIAVETARRLLASDEETSELDIPLGPEIGQCCGGWVRASLKQMDDAERDAMSARMITETFDVPHVYVMGAGHVGRALADQLQCLPLVTVLVDSREDQMNLCDATAFKRLTALPEAEIAKAEPGSAFIVATHDHGLDFLLTAAALRRGDAGYVGLIGSATKRAKFEAWCRAQEEAVPPDALVCPVGASECRDKRPAVIAAFVVAEVVAAISLTKSGL